MIDAAAPSPPRSRPPGDGAIALLAGGVALVLGGVLAPATYGPGDSPSLTTALALAGAPHPTGYPLWTLAGHVFVRAAHALGLVWPHAANLWSALGAAVAVALVVRLGTRLARRAGAEGDAAPRAALLAAAVLALDPVWLAGAAYAEVNAWHWAWVALALIVAEEQHARVHAGGTGDAARDGLAWGLVCALGLAHHRTMLAFALPLTAALGLPRVRRGGLLAWSIATGAVALAGLAPYGWIAYRAWHPAAGQWPLLEPGTARVWAHVGGSIYTVMFGGFAPGPSESALLARAVWPVLPLAVAGAVTLAMTSDGAHLRSFAAALLVAMLLQCGFTFAYGVPDPSNYFVPALLAGVATWPALAVRRPGHAHAALALLAALVAIALTAWTPVTLAEATKVRAVDRRIREVWASIPPGPAIVTWQSDQYARLQAFQVLEHQRPELVVENPDMLTWAPVRSAFTARTGIDPLAGLQLRAQTDVEQVPANIARRARVPVYRFEDLAR